jgi:two-component system sensor histidine kinase/response regulator
MGGDIWVRSAPGSGSTFGFEIDLAPCDVVPVRVARRVVHLAPGEPEWRMLVVDDAPENRLVLTSLLAAVGFSVRDATNGEDAVRIWRSWRPDLIWMDVRMPVLNGLEATRRIRSEEKARRDLGGRMQNEANPLLIRPSSLHPRPCKIVALTASVFEHERHEVLDAGADDLVLKPFRESTILDKVAEQLGATFLYEDVAPTSDAAEPLAPERIAALSRELVAAVYDALWVGDSDAALEAVEKIRACDEPLADELGRRIRGFQFSDLLSALKPRA